jgi:hypothetical protein
MTEYDDTILQKIYHHRVPKIREGTDVQVKIMFPLDRSQLEGLRLEWLVRGSITSGEGKLPSRYGLVITTTPQYKIGLLYDENHQKYEFLRNEPKLRWEALTDEDHELWHSDRYNDVDCYIWTF